MKAFYPVYQRVVVNVVQDIFAHLLRDISFLFHNGKNCLLKTCNLSFLEGVAVREFRSF